MAGVLFLLGGGGHQQDLTEVLCSSSLAAQLDTDVVACISFRLTPLITTIIVPRLVPMRNFFSTLTHKYMQLTSLICSLLLLASLNQIQ